MPSWGIRICCSSAFSTCEPERDREHEDEVGRVGVFLQRVGADDVAPAAMLGSTLNTTIPDHDQRQRDLGDPCAVAALGAPDGVAEARPWAGIVASRGNGAPPGHVAALPGKSPERGAGQRRPVPDAPTVHIRPRRGRRHHGNGGPLLATDRALSRRRPGTRARHKLATDRCSGRASPSGRQRTVISIRPWWAKSRTARERDDSE